MTPVLATSRAALATPRCGLPQPVVLVPTFVNPLQYGPGEDFGRYPRTLDRDLAICAEEGAAVVFAPGPGQMYPALRAGGRAAPDGPAAVRAAASAVLAEAATADPPLSLDYLALVAPDTFAEVPDGVTAPALLLEAASAGTTRLVDNAPLVLGAARDDGAGLSRGPVSQVTPRGEAGEPCC